MDSKDFYNINGKTYDLRNTLPVVNGIMLRSNQSICHAILELLHDCGYAFNFAHPCPPLLNNYNQVARIALIKLFKNLCLQLEDLPKSVLDLCTIGTTGLRISYNDSELPDRICKVIFNYDKGSIVKYMPLCQVTMAIRGFIDNVTSFKSVIVK